MRLAGSRRVLADCWGRRWPTTSPGPGGVPQHPAARSFLPPPQLFDRVAKGIREAPSKALMGQLAAAGGDSPAAAFALRQSLATLGALGGTLAASVALRASGYNYTLVFGLACAPAAAALVLLAAAFGGWGRPSMQEAGEERHWPAWQQSGACWLPDFPPGFHNAPDLSLCQSVPAQHRQRAPMPHWAEQYQLDYVCSIRKPLLAEVLPESSYRRWPWHCGGIFRPCRLPERH